MSFARIRIDEYLASKASRDQQRTEVGFWPTTIGTLASVIVAEEERTTDEQDVAEEAIERRLAEEGLIQLPTLNQKPEGEFRRIDVGGKPMSEVIIEERR